jgi:hypothetical protein
MVDSATKRPGQIWDWATLAPQVICVTVDQHGKVKAHTNEPTYFASAGMWHSKGEVPIGLFRTLPDDNATNFIYWRPGIPPRKGKSVMGVGGKSAFSNLETVPGAKTTMDKTGPVSAFDRSFATQASGSEIKAPNMEKKLKQMSEPAVLANRGAIQAASPAEDKMLQESSPAELMRPPTPDPAVMVDDSTEAEAEPAPEIPPAVVSDLKAFSAKPVDLIQAPKVHPGPQVTQALKTVEAILLALASGQKGGYAGLPKSVTKAFDELNDIITQLG